MIRQALNPIDSWGFWKKIHDKVIKEHPTFKRNTNFGRDWFNILIGIIWQASLVASPIYLIIQDFKYLIPCILVLAITSVILKVNWWDKLKSEEQFENA